MARNCAKTTYFAIPLFHPTTLIPLFLSFYSPDLVPFTTGSSKSLANSTKLIIPEVCRMSHKIPNKLFESRFINIKTAFVQSFLKTLLSYIRVQLTVHWDTRLFISGRHVQSFFFPGTCPLYSLLRSKYSSASPISFLPQMTNLRDN